MDISYGPTIKVYFLYVEEHDKVSSIGIER